MIRSEDGYPEYFKDLRRTFRSCFSAHPEVLHRILMELGTFGEIKNDPGAVALRNFGVWLLDIIGSNDEEITMDVVRSYLQLPFTPNTPPQEEM